MSGLNRFLWSSKRLLTACSALLLIICRQADVSAANTYGDMFISLNSPFSDETFHGYTEYSVSITNSSKDSPHSVSLLAPKNTYGGYGNYIERLSRTVIVPPASSITVPFLQPPVMVRGSDIEVTVDGTRQRKTLQFNSRHCTSYPHHYSGPSYFPVCVLLSRNVSFDDFSKGIEKAYALGSTAASSKYPGLICKFIRSETPVAAWNTEWLSYSCYDGIVVTGEDMSTMPAQVQAAILQYLQVGGSLLVLAPWQPPAKWLAAPGAEDSFDLHYVGLGLCVINRRSSLDTAAWDPNNFKFLRDQVWHPAASTMLAKKSIADTNIWFPVVAKLGVPIRGLFMTVFLFAVIAGPVNLLILSGKNRRIWILWTAPLISITASLAVLSYAFFAEGWRGHARIQAITLLDEASHRAATIAVSAFYCPLTPRGGLHYDYQTEINPLGFESYREGAPKSIDWTTDQHLVSGWVTARVPAHFIIRKNQMRRERVKIAPAGNTLEAFNGLGADIKKFWYSDRGGNIYLAEHIAAGAKKNLQPVNDPFWEPANPERLRKIFTSDWLVAYSELSEKPELYLRAGTYIAVLEDSPFVEQPLENTNNLNLNSVVFGFLSEQDDAG